MRKTLSLLPLLFLLILPLFAQERRVTEHKPFALTHVTVIDATGTPAKRDMTVVIAGGRIAVIGKNKKVHMLKDTQIINATGKFLIPGLWDMHAHVGEENFDKGSYLPLFIANGVTGIRIMSGEPVHHLWRKEIESGVLLGPRIFIASRIIDGPKSFLSDAVIVSNLSEGTVFIVNRPRVKICCIINLDEARVAIKYGASALGFVSEMPRVLELLQKRRLLKLRRECHRRLRHSC